MELVKIENLNFAYGEERVLNDVSLSVSSGEILLVAGESGSGKSTLLKLIKKEIAPFGKQSGSIDFFGKEIGFVFQNAESSIVTDKVYSELAFSLENKGTDSKEITLKISETASFFNLEDVFEKDVSELSGGEKKILSLACAMVDEPELLILDEPISCLDPIAAEKFISLVKKVNEQLGTTIIMVEHNFENVFAIADSVVVLEKGKLSPKMDKLFAVEYLKNNMLFDALPVSARLFGNAFTVKDGKRFLESKIKNVETDSVQYVQRKIDISLKAKNVWYSYNKKENDVLKGVNYKAEKGKINSILGGNGSGKSTLLKVLSGVYNPYCGKVKCTGNAALMPQNVKDLFCEETVDEELNGENKETVINRFSLAEKRNSHPYDLSGGEMEKLAFAKVLMENPDVVLLDEPTQGLDIARDGKTVILVSHDIEFIAKISDNISFLFGGKIVSSGDKYSFLSSMSYYTSDEYRISRNVFKNAVDFDSLKTLIRENGYE